VIPSPWVGIVLALAAFRLTRFVGWDSMPILLKARVKLTGENRSRRGEDVFGNEVWYQHPGIARLIFCAWCVGFWICCAVYISWIEEPRWTLYAAIPLALSSIVGLVSKNWDP